MSMRRDGTVYEGVVVQSYATEDDAVRAVRALQDAGFSADQVSVIARDKDVATSVADETGTEATEGAVTGAVTGGVLGAVAAALAGLASVAIPGVGIVIGGVLAGAIAGAAGGGLLGGLVGMGIPEEEARLYNERFEAGDIIVTVVAGDRELEARTILRGGTAWNTYDRGTLLESDYPAS